MHCPNESHFKVYVQKLYNDFQHISTVNAYLRSGKNDPDVLWKTLWPKFRKNIFYGGMDTINHVERHWELIEYTLLQGNLNRSL